MLLVSIPVSINEGEDSLAGYVERCYAKTKKHPSGVFFLMQPFEVLTPNLSPSGRRTDLVPG